MSKLVLQPSILTTPEAGSFEWDSKVPYFTPQGTQRGVVPGMQYYRLNSSLVGSNVNTAQSLFGVGVTLSASTIYEFEGLFALSKNSGAISHTIGIGFGGTATVTNASFTISGTWFGSQLSPTGYAGALVGGYNNSLSNNTVTASLANANSSTWGVIRGTVSVNIGGTLIPQYTLSAAPGGAYSTEAGGYFLIYPIGAAGNNISVGTWT